MYLRLASVLPAILLVTSVAADGASIAAALEDVTNKAVKVNTTVASWKGDAIGLIRQFSHFLKEGLVLLLVDASGHPFRARSASCFRSHSPPCARQSRPRGT